MHVESYLKYRNKIANLFNLFACYLFVNYLLYKQALICYGPYLYTVGGTTGYEYTCDIHRFDLRTGIWETVYVCLGRDSLEPPGRYRHELAFDGEMIYILGGGTSIDAFGFSVSR